MENNVTIIKGNIFNSHSQTIVNTVNCVGVMGKGIALVYKLRYPQLFEKYQAVCKKGLLDIGKLWLYKEEDNVPWVLNFPTKKHWKFPSEYGYIEAGLQKFLSSYKEKGITSIAFPLLGANNGGLEPNKVLDIMKKFLSQCDIPVDIYLYDPQSKDDLFDLFKEKWNLIPADKIKNITGIRMQKQIDIISNALNSGDIQSLISLIEYPGIGLATMQKCYKMVMESKDLDTPNLFDLQEDSQSLPFITSSSPSDIIPHQSRQLDEEQFNIYHYIIDTNVFINCPDILSKIDCKHKIVLSAKVADELDRMKVKLSDKERKNAEKALRILNRSDREVRFELSDSSLLPDDFDKRSPDNLILSVALKYKTRNPIMLTSDNGLQIKSKILQIPTISLKDFLAQAKPWQNIT